MLRKSISFKQNQTMRFYYHQSTPVLIKGPERPEPDFVRGVSVRGSLSPVKLLGFSMEICGGSLLVTRLPGERWELLVLDFRQEKRSVSVSIGNDPQSSFDGVEEIRFYDDKLEILCADSPGAQPLTPAAPVRQGQAVQGQPASGRFLPAQLRPAPQSPAPQTPVAPVLPPQRAALHTRGEASAGSQDAARRLREAERERDEALAREEEAQKRLSSELMRIDRQLARAELLVLNEPELREQMELYADEIRACEGSALLAGEGTQSIQAALLHIGQELDAVRQQLRHLIEHRERLQSAIARCIAVSDGVMAAGEEGDGQHGRERSQAG